MPVHQCTSASFSESLSIAAGLCGSKYIFKFIYIIIYINYIIAISDAVHHAEYPMTH